MNSIDKAKELMEARLVELEEERAKIKNALAVLGKQNGVAPSKHRVRRTRRTVKRAGRGARQVQFLNVITKHPGEPIGEIARRMGVRPQQVYPIARRLSDRGAIAKLNGGYEAKKNVATA